MSKSNIIPIDFIEQRIFLLRGQKVMLSPHLAILYGVEPKVLLQAVKRNNERFPKDFMFQLGRKETNALKMIPGGSRSQFVTLNRGQNIKYQPYAFTEQGVAMLSSVLRSKKAIQVNIAIMRAFVKLRKVLATHKDLARKLIELERKFENHDEQIKTVFEAIRQLMMPPEKPKRPIGFRLE